MFFIFFSLSVLKSSFFGEADLHNRSSSFPLVNYWSLSDLIFSLSKFFLVVVAAIPHAVLLCYAI